MRIAPPLSALTFSLCLIPAVLAQQEPAVLPGPPPVRGVPGRVQFESMEAPGPGLAIVQDHQGFMWFGGRGGLYRYDGYDYTQYQHDPQDSTSLSINWVETLSVDRRGTLWVGTFGGGLHRYDPGQKAFTRFRHDPADPTSLSQDTVTVIFEDRRGTLWVGTHAGLNRFDAEAGAFTRFRHDPDDPTSLSNDQVRVLYEDRRGTLWVGTGSGTPSETPAGEGGLNRFDPETGTPGSGSGQAFTRYLHDPQDETSLASNKVMALLEDSRGTFWVGTLGDGLHTMDRAQGTFTRLRYDAKDPTKLSRPFAGTTTAAEHCDAWDCGGVSFLHEDRSGVLWIGALSGGIVRYDPATGVKVHHEAATSGLGDNDVWRLYESHDGTFWIGTLYDGLDRFDRATGRFTHFRHDPQRPTGLGSAGVLSLYGDREGTLWIGGDGVLSRYVPATGRFTHHRHDPKNPASLSPGWVTDLLEDRQGRLWVGSFEGGLGRLDPTTGLFTHYRNHRGDPQSLTSNMVVTLHEDREGTLWVGTTIGLSRFDAEREAFTTVLVGRSVEVLYEDSRGTFWVGTGNDGLHRFDRITGTSTRYGRLEGLPAGGVVGIIEDKDGYLWVSTAEGGGLEVRQGKLSRFDPRSGAMVSFGGREGLPEIGFIKECALRSRDGTLFFGGNGGLMAFDPKSRSPPS